MYVCVVCLVVYFSMLEKFDMFVTHLFSSFLSLEAAIGDSLRYYCKREVFDSTGGDAHQNSSFSVSGTGL